MTDRNTQARVAFDCILQAMDRLQGTGCNVIAQIWTGQKPVLMLDKPPRFVRGVLKSRKVGTRTVHRTYAAPFHGVQLEWIVSTPIAQAVGHA